MKQVTIIGIGMGNKDTLTIEGKKFIHKAQVLIGAKRMVEGFHELGKEEFLSYDSGAIGDFILSSGYQYYSILMSGDTGFYSGTKTLVKRLEGIEGIELKVLPGISSLSYFCAKLLIPWEDVYSMSLHGRRGNLCQAVKKHEKTFVLTQGDIGEICGKLKAAGLGEVIVYVGENLSYENERIVKGITKEFTESSFSSSSVMLIVNPFCEPVLNIGIEEEEFIRGEVPMTKSEIRAISLSKLRLKEKDIVYDIGAGTGSVSVEMAIAASKGIVYAIEERKEAVELIEKNKEKFALDNIEIISGHAPEALEGLKIPDAAFIGGSRGNLSGIVKTLLHLNNKLRLVINAIALETLTEALTVLKEAGLTEIDIVQASITKAKKAGSYHMMMGQNPVFIISAKGSGNEKG